MYNSEFFNSFEIIYCILDYDFKILYANDLFMEMFGYSEKEIINKDINSFTENIDWANIKKELKSKDIYKSESSLLTNLPKLAKSNKIRIDVRINVFNAPKEENFPAASFVAQFFDMTEETQLRQDKKILELIIDKVPYSLFWKDTKSIYMGGNGAYRELLGFGQNYDIIGKSEYDLRNDREITEAFIAEDNDLLTSKNEINHRESRIRRDGKSFWVSTSKVLVKDESDKPFAILGIIEDITKRKNEEKEKYETLAKFSALIKNYPGIIWCINNDYKFTVMEGLELKEMGLSPLSSEETDATGGKISDVLKNYPVILEKLERTFDDGPQNWIYTVNNSSYSFSTSFIIGADGSQVGIICTATDITQNMQIQEQLVAAIEKAENANRAKSEFLSRMSHEIRTPINAVIGMTKIALHSKQFDKMINSLEKIDAASEQLLGIINDILDMSKIEAQKFEINSEPFYFKSMIDKIYNMIIVKTDEKNIKFELDINSGVINNYIGDELRLTQVIINLLSNAVKFTPEKGLIKMSATAVPDLSLKAQSETDYMIIEFKVTDNGIGISKEQQVKLFNSFEQADGTIARKYGGTGLGLAICKKIVELMGGNIYVESETGKGSSFIFTVKLKKNDIKSAQGGDNNANGSETVNFPETSDFSDYYVILAEDVELNREVVVSLLEDTKLNIDCAENGEEAYKLFSENQERYDLILMDIQMPVMDGYEATRKIRSLNTHRALNIPIIAMTANAFQEDIEASRKAGMNGHITKPIDMPVLMDRLRKFLLHRRKNTYVPVSSVVPSTGISETKPEKIKQPVTAAMLLPDINLEDALERISGNKKLLVSLLKSFKGIELFELLVTKLAEDEIKESIRAASKLKESGKNLGMPLLYSAAVEIESALISAGGLLGSEHILKLKKSIDAVSEKITLIIQNNFE